MVVARLPTVHSGSSYLSPNPSPCQSSSSTLLVCSQSESALVRQSRQLRRPRRSLVGNVIDVVISPLRLFPCGMTMAAA
ncbi:hypothetical protein Cob_v011825 [Colletotrichum orbiculare MAFF 240422]|uniref:Uncharacterized protein n=1 Tax=Colletotrichum orbiculare (strain 104-T / ATCC 96160 / CBS 514.97 / LARS 414 / MAFF 240422) TaxID=1213857 RepID=A0A484FCL4_COLOR|nr:hypothetical protein Cob_v011825 [Colletotrichum orbiculare MAFF 240422]